MILENKVEKDVDIELKQLEEMGDLNSIQKPAFLVNNLTSYDLSNDEVGFLLTDVEQFLLFEGEFQESKSSMWSNNYEEIEKVLMDKIQQIQHSSVFKALKRVIK